MRPPPPSPFGRLPRLAPLLCVHGLLAVPCQQCHAPKACYHPGAACGCGWRPVGFVVAELTGGGS